MYLPEIQVLPTGVQVADHKAQALQYLLAPEKTNKQAFDVKKKYYQKVQKKHRWEITQEGS